MSQWRSFPSSSFAATTSYLCHYHHHLFIITVRVGCLDISISFAIDGHFVTALWHQRLYCCDHRHMESGDWRPKHELRPYQSFTISWPTVRLPPASSWLVCTKCGYIHIWVNIMYPWLVTSRSHDQGPSPTVGMWIHKLWMVTATICWFPILNH